MNPKLEVQGFGVEILSRRDPTSLFTSANPSATEAALHQVDFNHYGTRHRSMMRYCSQVPGTLGFVVHRMAM